MPRARVSRLSWIRFFPEDFLGGTQQMTCQEVGQYMLALCAQWGAERGAERTGLRPADGSLKAVLRGEVMAPAVRAKFESVELESGTFLRNRRMSLEISESEAEWQARVRGAERTAERTGLRPAERTQTTTTTTSTNTGTSNSNNGQQPTDLPAEPALGSIKLPTDAEKVLAYWSEKTDTKIRVEAVKAEHLKRISKWLKEGFTADQLRTCVDAALGDPYYVAQGYQKRPSVIWKSAARIDELLAKAATPKKSVKDIEREQAQAREYERSQNEKAAQAARDERRRLEAEQMRQRVEAS